MLVARRHCTLHAGELALQATRRTAAVHCVGLSMLVVASACQLDSHLTPLTQVVVDVDGEAQVKARSADVELVVRGGQTPDETWEAAPAMQRSIELGQDGAPTWPLRLVLVPRDRDAQRLFAISATAHDGAGGVVAQARLLSGYVSNEIRYVQLELSDDCQDIVCASTQTCRAGACADAVRAAESLGVYRPSLDAGAPIDAAQLDASADAGSDAGFAHDTGVGADDANQCDHEHGGCDPLVTCQSAEGQAVCGACPSGFDDAHGDGTSCTDIDECQVDRGGCDAKHGLCTNVPGGRVCSCNEGYHGDGMTCTENPGCQADGDCSSQANCRQRHCVCNAGYTGDGLNCSDIDECQADLTPCAAHADCQNTPGSFQCLCQQGYAGAPDARTGCLDIDECATHASDCDDEPNACINRDGGFDCRCPSGYSGDGKGAMGCSDVDECATNNGGCDSLRACTNTPGSFGCGSCASGYATSGSTGCVVIDVCATNNGGCDPQRSCKSNDGGVSCGKCQAGYSNDGDTGCVDDDECAKKKGSCGAHRRCNNTPGSFECGDCEDGYHADDSGSCTSND
jgi:hypothetical protein